MSIEAEVKARVQYPDQVRQHLAQWVDAEIATYSDTYFHRGPELAEDDRELRVREVRTDDNTINLLTYKGATVDADSGSKGEWETSIADAETMRTILVRLGFEVYVALTKDCTNYRFDRDGRSILATIVRVPEIDDTFIEVETTAEESELDAALAAVRDVLRELGIGPADETRETYTGAVLAAREGTG